MDPHYNDNISFQRCCPLRKLKILPPKKIENFQIKNSYIFHISTQKHRLWALVRTASAIMYTPVNPSFTI